MINYRVFSRTFKIQQHRYLVHLYKEVQMVLKRQMIFLLSVILPLNHSKVKIFLTNIFKTLDMALIQCLQFVLDSKHPRIKLLTTLNQNLCSTTKRRLNTSRYLHSKIQQRHLHSSCPYLQSILNIVGEASPTYKIGRQTLF